MRARLLSLLGMFLLAACGGGGGGGGNGGNGGGNNPPPVAAPTNLSYSNPPALVVSQQMAALSPTVTGTVTSYSVNPALPAGLAINATSGVISGTPTAATAAATYTVTATNASGSTTVGVSITVNAAPPATPVISYGSESYTFTTGLPATPAAAVNSGGAVASWSIAPALPAGLTFSTTDGSISGTPTDDSAAATYTITAQNASGSDTAELTLAVDSAVLMELGHDRPLISIRRSGNRVLSIDYSGHWVLWNATSTDILARGDVTCEGEPCELLVDLAGATFAVRVSTGLEVRDAADGHVLASIATPASWWKLASDGSYVAAGSTTEVAAWSSTGTQLFTKPGNYASAKAFAAPAELRLAAGAAGADRLETIVVSTGASSDVQFAGQFHSWFLDGDRFLTNLANTVWVYGADGTQLDLRALPGAFTRLVGQGDWFWTRSNTVPQLKIYAVGASASPAATFNYNATFKFLPAADTIGIFSSGQGLSIIDLSGATPVKVDQSQPLLSPRAYYATASGDWLVGNEYGVLIARNATPGSTRYFGNGQAFSIVANTARIAVATASGTVFYFDAATRALEGTIDFSGTQLQLSADGTVLAGVTSSGYSESGDRSLKIFSLPSEAILRDDPYDTSVVPYPVDISLAASGQTFGRVLRTSNSIRREVLAVGGGPLIWSDELLGENDPVALYLSPDGSRIAAPDGTGIPDTADTVNTNIIVNGVLASAVPGIAAGWIDDNQLLVNRYATVSPDTHFPKYVGSDIVDANGLLIRSVVLSNWRDTRTFQTVDTDRVYSSLANVIVSLTDGATLWSSPNVTSWGGGGVTATHVIFGSRGSVRAEPY